MPTTPIVLPALLMFRKLIVDTSAINRLHEDAEREIIVPALITAYRIGMPETVVSEVIAHRDEEKRRTIFRLFKRLLNVQGESKGHCTMPFNWILEEQAKTFNRDPSVYDWRKLNIAWSEGDNEIAREEFVHILSDETRRNMEEWDNQFAEIFQKARPAFQNIFLTGSERPCVEDVSAKLLGGGGAHLAIGADLVEKALGSRPTEAETKEFMERCPPFKALLSALCVAQYDRCIRGDREPWIGKAGRVDMFSATYLPYCNVYLTDDKGQSKALTKVAELAGINVEVKRYVKFKEELFGFG